MEKLSRAVRRILDAVQVIAVVVQRTNLLSLNATIEAARAGAAGRGFAVIAAKVKSSAVEAGEATARIAEEAVGLAASIKDGGDHDPVGSRGDPGDFRIEVEWFLTNVRPPDPGGRAARYRSTGPRRRDFLLSPDGSAPAGA
jgi:hypothetical protein